MQLKINFIFYYYIHIYKMDKLNNLFITNPDGVIVYDFAHVPVSYIDNTILTPARARIIRSVNNNYITGTNNAYTNANVEVINNMLNLNQLIYRLEIAYNTSGKSLILKEKLDRAKAMRNVISNSVLLLIHTMYWTDLNKLQRSTISLKKAFDFGISVGQDLCKKFEDLLDKEYDLASILEIEYGKTGVNNNVRK